MANKNKNIKELVSEDEDPTAELETPTFRQHEHDGDTEQRESDAHTYGLGRERSDAGSGQSIPELQSDLESRTKTIGKLQYDIEQLRSKWLGLETEISAREEIANNLLKEVQQLKKRITQKEDLLKKRNESIKDLKAEIKQREQDYQSLQADLEAQQLAAADEIAAREAAEQDLEEMRAELENARAEIASAETEIEKHGEQNALLEQQLADRDTAAAEHISALDDSRKQSVKLRAELETARTEIETARADIDERDSNYASLEQQLDELRAADAERRAELESVQGQLANSQSELEAAAREEHNLNMEVNQRDELYALLEEKYEELGQRLAAQHDANAENLAALQDARDEIEGLSAELEAVRNASAAEIVETQQVTSTQLLEMNAQREKTEAYADTLRHQLKDLNETLVDVSADREALKQAVAALTQSKESLETELETLRASSTDIDASIEKLRAEHEQELRTLRFELGEAQGTLDQTSDLNKQLASDLVDARNYKEELERMLTKSEEQAQQRAADLEKQVKKLTEVAEDFEQKLETKNTAINVLLGELSKKSEQIDSIGEIEDVIHELDSRMSERIDEVRDGADKHPAAAHAGERDRYTRVLVGNAGDQELRFPLFKNRLTIGRTPENDIQLKTAYISRRHAVVLTEGESTRIIDWGSKNGVYVNSEKVKEHFLSNGDIVSVGNVKFRYEERPKRDA